MENKYFKVIDHSSFSSAMHVLKTEQFSQGKVFHYTQKESLFKILDSNILRLSNINKLNDPLEISFGLDVIKNILSKEGSCDDIIRFIDEKVRDTFVEIPAFVFSTTAEQDSHLQWINYADRGKGISIQINRKKLFNLIKKQNNGQFVYVYPIIYFSNDYKRQNKHINYYESLVSDYLKVLFSNPANLGDPQFVIEVKSLIIIFASMIKNAFHQNELEWRYLILTKADDHNIDYSVNTNEIKPFYKLLLDKENSWLEGLMFGPDTSNNENALNDFYGVLKKKVSFSLKEMTRSKGLIR